MASPRSCGWTTSSCSSTGPMCPRAPRSSCRSPVPAFRASQISARTLAWSCCGRSPRCTGSSGPKSTSSTCGATAAGRGSISCGICPSPASRCGAAGERSTPPGSTRCTGTFPGSLTARPRRATGSLTTASRSEARGDGPARARSTLGRATMSPSRSTNRSSASSTAAIHFRSRSIGTRSSTGFCRSRTSSWSRSAWISSPTRSSGAETHPLLIRGLVVRVSAVLGDGTFVLGAGDLVPSLAPGEVIGIFIQSSVGEADLNRTVTKARLPSPWGFLQTLDRPVFETLHEARASWTPRIGEELGTAVVAARGRGGDLRDVRTIDLGSDRAPVNVQLRGRPTPTVEDTLMSAARAWAAVHRPYRRRDHAVSHGRPNHGRPSAQPPMARDRRRADRARRGRSSRAACRRRAAGLAARGARRDLAALANPLGPRSRQGTKLGVRSRFQSGVARLRSPRDPLSVDTDLCSRGVRPGCRGGQEAHVPVGQTRSISATACACSRTRAGYEDYWYACGPRSRRPTYLYPRQAGMPGCP